MSNGPRGGISRRCTNGENVRKGSRRHCGAGGLMRTASYPILMSLALGFLGSVNPAYGVSILASAVSTEESSQLGKEQNRAVCSLILESDGRFLLTITDVDGEREFQIEASGTYQQPKPGFKIKTRSFDEEALKDSIGKAFEGLFKRTPDSVEIKKIDAKFTASKRSVSSIVFCTFKLTFRVDDGGTERRGRIRFKGPGLLYASPGILHLP